MKNLSPINQNRRSFIRRSSAGLMVMSSALALGSQQNSKIQLGVIGSGGRGFFVGKKFVDTVGGDIHLAAAHDYFEDRLERFQNLFDIPAARCYTGIDGYKDILASDVDGVIITTPPYFHPQQAQDAVAAGKHVWLAKPIAVDVPGCQSIRETGKQAQGKVAFLVDFQTRNSPFFVEAVKRVREGAIGKIICGQAFNQFPCGGWASDPSWTKPQTELRNWGTNPVFSGDVIVEQAVHAVDIVNQFLDAVPAQAYAVGGLGARLNAGKNWDHFLVIYEYPNNVKIELNVAQFMKDYEDLGARLYGSEGVVDAHYRALDWGAGPVAIYGQHAWEGTEMDNTWDIGVENNCRDFVQAIRTGNYMNHAAYSADSTMTGILGREAAYRQRVVTWEELVKENKKLELGFEL